MKNNHLFHPFKTTRPQRCYPVLLIPAARLVRYCLPDAEGVKGIRRVLLCKHNYQFCQKSAKFGMLKIMA